MYRKILISSIISCVFAAPPNIDLMSYSKLPTAMHMPESDDDSYSTSDGDYDTDFSSDSDFDPVYPRLLRTSERADAQPVTEDFYVERVDIPPSVAPSVVRLNPPSPSVVSFAVSIDAEVEHKPVFHIAKSTAMQDLTTLRETTTSIPPSMPKSLPVAVHKPHEPKKPIFKKHINYQLPDYKFNQLDKRTIKPYV